MSRFTDKIAIVTGAGRGIGEAVSRRLIAEGATVIGAGLSGTVDNLAEELGDRMIAQVCDVSDEGQVEDLYARCRERFGRLDLLFNNAGIAKPKGRIHEVPVDVWDRVMDVNLRGAYLVLRGGLSMMLEGAGGSIVNTASIGGLRPTIGSAPYSITKAALVMMTRMAALEYANDDIRVNCVCPGTVMTPMLDNGGPELIRRKEAITPIGRIATAEEVAAVSCFLLSDEAPSVTGASYTVAGGREAQ